MSDKEINEMLDAQKRMMSIPMIFVEIGQAVRAKAEGFKNNGAKAKEIREYADSIMDLLVQVKDIADK